MQTNAALKEMRTDKILRKEKLLFPAGGRKQWESIEEENQAYWTKRADSYAQTIRAELSDDHVAMWGDVLREEMAGLTQKTGRLTVLEAGTGPGFLSILLAQMGHSVTGIDYTQEMLNKAKENAALAGADVRFLKMNTEALDFADEIFDLVVSRNLTWNLPHPDRAYAEWMRVLKPGGKLLVFDANYYNFLYDEEARKGYDRDREKTAQAGEDDIYLCTDTAAMEAIARQVPLSAIRRPQWDLELLRGLGAKASVDENIWRRVWDRNEQINQASVPMFMVRAEKAGNE